MEKLERRDKINYYLDLAEAGRPGRSASGGPA